MGSRSSAYRVAMRLPALLARSIVVLAAAAIGCVPFPASGQGSSDELESALTSARGHGIEAARYERARNYRAAMQEYQRAIADLADYAGRTASGPNRTSLPVVVYFSLASARLDLARAWVLSGLMPVASAGEQARFGANLTTAKKELQEALAISSTEASAGDETTSLRTSRIHNALAWEAILEGDVTTARAQAQEATSLNRDNPYAASLDRAIAALAADVDTATITSRGSVQPARSEQLLASLKSVIEVDNLIGSAAPAGGTEVAMRGTSTPSTRTPCPAAFTGTCYPVWYGTNRKPVDPADPSKGFTGEYDEQMRFGKRIVFIPRGHRPGELGSPLWKRLLIGDDRIEVGPTTNLTERAFAEEIRAVLARLDPDDRNVLVYIHGFNTSFDDAARRAAQLGFDLKVPGVTAFYSWPSRGSARDYVADVENVEASEEHIAQFLVKTAELADHGRVHIIAHSMGNRGLLRALHRATAQAAFRSGVRFGKIFLAAPDVDAKLFRQLASVYPQISEHTTLYVADNDRALAALEWFSRDPRAGSVPPLLLIPGIDTIRVRGASLFRLGHSYVAEDINVIRDISTLLYANDSPDRRRLRNGWPVPDRTPEGRGAWIIGN